MNECLPLLFPISVTCKKSPNVYKSCPKMISLEKLKILTLLQKLPKNVVDLGKLIVAIGFKTLPKVQLIGQSGHTVPNLKFRQKKKVKAIPLIQ